jgi:putative serine protease PepD
MPAQKAASSGYTLAGHRVHWMPHRRLFSLGLILLAILVLSGCVSSKTATQPTAGPPATIAPGANDLQQNVINVIRAVQPSVVEIEGFSSTSGSIGSGEILTSDGYIVTNDHVVRGFTSFTVRVGANQIVSARLIGEAPQDDLAVLKAAASKLSPISFGDSSKVQVGQFAVAIGSPLGLEETATMGIVSGLNRAATEGQNGPASTLVGLIQTSAPINPGNSGGALVDLRGQLIGIPTLAAVDPQIGAPANGIGFAIPSNRVQFVAQQLMKYGKLVSSGQGFLGIEGRDVTPQQTAANAFSEQSGVLVTGFASDTSGKSPAQQAGVKIDDVIVAINTQQIASTIDLAAITLAVTRGGNKQTIPVMLGERPVSS